MSLPHISDALNLAIWAYHAGSVRTPKKLGRKSNLVKRRETGPKKWNSGKWIEGGMLSEICKRPRDSTFTMNEFFEGRRESSVKRMFGALRSRGILVNVAPGKKGRPSIWMFNQEWQGHPEIQNRKSEFSGSSMEVPSQQWHGDGFRGTMGLGGDLTPAPAPAPAPTCAPSCQPFTLPGEPAGFGAGWEDDEAPED